MNSNLKILGIIPARKGSKGIPRKNIKLLNGKPLIQYTFEVALKSEKIDKLILSSDDQDICNLARKFGVEVPFLRPEHLASDTARSTDVMKHAIIEMERIDKIKYDIIVYLEPTSPLRILEDINRGIDLFLANDVDSIASIVEVVQYHPLLMKKIENNRLLGFAADEPEGIPRQLLKPKAYMRNGAIYLFYTKNIMNNILWGKNVFPYEMPPERSVSIDDINDWMLAESYLKNNPEKI